MRSGRPDYSSQECSVLLCRRGYQYRTSLGRRVILWLFLPGATLGTALDAIDVYSRQVEISKICYCHS